MPYGVKANIRAPHRYMRFGALVWISNCNYGNAQEKLQVVGLSRGGHKSITWVDARDLGNFRAGWFPDQQSTANDGDKEGFESREQAEALAKSMQQRFGDQPVREHAAKFGAANRPA